MTWDVLGIGIDEPLDRAWPPEQKPPLFRRPELLTHPNLPKPLHGVNPRTVMGQKWWNEKRQEAYAKNNYCCWACGTHKSVSLYRDWLEAHEAYEVDYPNGRMEIKEIVALCHACHNFIHSGRLYNTLNEDNEGKFLFVLRRGLRILKENALQPYWGTLFVLEKYKGATDTDAMARLASRGIIPNEVSMARWEDWRLIIDGVEYPPKFANLDEWREHYERPPGEPARRGSDRP